MMQFCEKKKKNFQNMTLRKIHIYYPGSNTILQCLWMDKGIGGILPNVIWSLHIKISSGYKPDDVLSFIIDLLYEK